MFQTSALLYQNCSGLQYLCALSQLWRAVCVFAQSPHFADITAKAGIHFAHNNGAFGKKWLPETMGPGCAFIDYDNDGYQDIVLINGEDFPGARSGPLPRR